MWESCCSVVRELEFVSPLAVHISPLASCLIISQSIIILHKASSPTASSPFQSWDCYSECLALYCPHLPFVFSMVDRSGRVPSAHESGYCIILCHKLTSSPTESISTSSFSINTFPTAMKETWWIQKLCCQRKHNLFHIYITFHPNNNEQKIILHNKVKCENYSPLSIFFTSLPPDICNSTIFMYCTAYFSNVKL